MKRKSILNPSGVEWTDYNCNYVLGCGHNCAYCYARLNARRFPKLHMPRSSVWSRPELVENALELLREAVKRKPLGRVMVASTHDPYMPIPEVQELTREVLHILLEAGFQVQILTKSADVKRDFRLLGQYPNVELGFTFTSWLPSPYEPGSSTPEERFLALKTANLLGIRTFVSIEPWIPGVTDPFDIVEKLTPFTDRFIIGRLNHERQLGIHIPDGYYSRFMPRLMKLDEELERLGVDLIIKEELLREITPDQLSTFAKDLRLFRGSHPR